jgi:hypothetical protein
MRTISLLYPHDVTQTVDMSLHDVPTQPIEDAGGQLQVDVMPPIELAERRALQRLSHHLRGERRTADLASREAYPVDRDRVPSMHPARRLGGLDVQRQTAFRLADPSDHSSLGDDPGEHQPLSGS